MVDLNKIDNNFKKYSELNERIKVLEKEKSNFEIMNFDNLHCLHTIYMLTVENRYELKEQFIRLTPLLQQYFFYKKNIDEKYMKINELLLNKSAYEGCKSFIALKHTYDDEYDLVDLKSNNIINTSGFSDEKKEFIIDNLKATNLFVCFATQQDLPLLMTLLEENLSNYNMFVEFEKAKMFDDRCVHKTVQDPIGKNTKELNNKLPFIYDDLIIETRWDELDKKKKELSIDDYWIEYFKTLLITHKNSKDIYEMALESDKLECLVKAYRYYTKPNLECIHFRTSDPIINMEILKLEHKNVR